MTKGGRRRQTNVLRPELQFWFAFACALLATSWLISETEQQQQQQQQQHSTRPSMTTGATSMQANQHQQQHPPAQIRRQVVKKYRRPNNLPKASTRINCPVCASDFMAKRVTIDDACFNPRFNLATAELELITQCPLASRNCTTETVYVNGVLTSIKRKCGQVNSCADNCVVAGLGLTSKTCSVCCPPFEYDSYNTDVFKPRECA